MLICSIALKSLSLSSLYSAVYIEINSILLRKQEVHLQYMYFQISVYIYTSFKFELLQHICLTTTTNNYRHIYRLAQERLHET